MITLLFTDGSLVPIGQPIARFLQVQVTLNFNAPASVTVTVPAFDDYVQIVQPGNRLIVVRDGAVLVAGPIEYPASPLSWSPDGSNQDAEPGLLTFGATDDSAWLEARIVYPDPAHASTAQTAAFYTLSATNAETAMRNLVNLNAGPGALVARQVPNLILGSVASVGTNISVRSRFDSLGDQLRAAALSGGGLGYKVVQDGTDLKFVVYQPADLSGTVRFSRGLGNLRSLQYTSQAPTATVAIVGGDGTGTSRTIVERSNSGQVTTWGRMETFVNDSSTDTTDLQQNGDNALTAAAEQGQVIVQAVDVPPQKFGVHYNLGDVVSVEVAPGVELADVVRAVTITATKDGEVVNPQIGTASSSNDPVITRRLRATERRVGELERKREV